MWLPAAARRAVSRWGRVPTVARSYSVRSAAGPPAAARIALVVLRDDPSIWEAAGFEVTTQFEQSTGHTRHFVLFKDPASIQLELNRRPLGEDEGGGGGGLAGVVLGGGSGGGREFVPGVPLLPGFKFLPGLSAATAAEGSFRPVKKDARPSNRPERPLDEQPPPPPPLDPC